MFASGELRRLIDEDGLHGLEDDGVEKFIKAFDKLMESISKKSSEK